MINIYSTPDCRQVHISFDEREPLPPLTWLEQQLLQDRDERRERERESERAEQP